MRRPLLTSTLGRPKWRMLRDAAFRRVKAHAMRPKGRVAPFHSHGADSVQISLVAQKEVVYATNQPTSAPTSKATVSPTAQAANADANSTAGTASAVPAGNASKPSRRTPQQAYFAPTTTTRLGKMVYETGAHSVSSLCHL